MTAAPLAGLVGLKGSGKDSFAAALAQRHRFRRLAFADPLKVAALRSDPIIYAHGRDLSEVGDVRLSSLVETEGWESVKRGFPEVRRYLQEFGTSIRALDPGFWLRPVMESASVWRRGGVPVVVTDVRFTNEADAIEAAGGVLVRIERPGLLADDPHVSETELAARKCSFRIVNDGSLDDLAALATDLVSRLR